MRSNTYGCTRLENLNINRHLYIHVSTRHSRIHEVLGIMRHGWTCVNMDPNQDDDVKGTGMWMGRRQKREWAKRRNADAQVRPCLKPAAFGGIRFLSRERCSAV